MAKTRKKQILKPTIYPFYINESVFYPYKSENIVDLLEEVEAIKNIKPNTDAVFSPKPFTFSNMILPNTDIKIYSPARYCLVYKHDLRGCLCVHICKQFESYPTTDLGIKIVPAGAPCAFSKNGICECSCLALNRKIKKRHAPGYLITVEYIKDLNIPRR